MTTTTKTPRPALYTRNGSTTEITVGMGVTMGIGSDSYAYSVSKVVGPKTVEVTRDKVTPGPTFDYWGNQDDVTYESRLDAKGTTLTLRADGQWRQAGSTKCSGYRWHFGSRRQYSNPSF